MSALVDWCDRCGAELRPPTPQQHRSVEAVYQDLAASGIVWPPKAGRCWNPFAWHQLMIAAFAEDKGWQPIIAPSLNGTKEPVIVLRVKQSRLTGRQSQELIHFARAWAIDHGVELRAPA